MFFKNLIFTNVCFVKTSVFDRAFLRSLDAASIIRRAPVLLHRDVFRARVGGEERQCPLWVAHSYRCKQLDSVTDIMRVSTQPV